MDKQYKAIVFDYGGVIRISKDRDLMSTVADIVDISVSNLREEYFKHNNLSNVHNMPWEEMFMKVLERYELSDEQKKEIQELIQKDHQSKVLNQGLVEIMSALKSKGYKMAVFSNNTKGLKINLKEDGILTLLDDVVVSGEIGYQKPQREAFDVLFSRLNVKPSQVIFIDDSQKSLETADEIGYKPIRFTSNEGLELQLSELGITL